MMTQLDIPPVGRSRTRQQLRTDPVLDAARRLAKAEARSAAASDHHEQLLKAASTPAGDVQLAFDVANELADATLDIAMEFETVTATTLPGLAAHVKHLRQDLGYGALADQLCDQVLVGIAALDAGIVLQPCLDRPGWKRPAASLPALLDQLRLLEAVLIDVDKTNDGWVRLTQREAWPGTGYEPDLPVRICHRIIAGAEAMIATPPA